MTGDVFLAGSFNATCDFDPLVAKARLTASGANMFFVKYGSVFIGVEENANTVSFCIYRNPVRNELTINGF